MLTQPLTKAQMDNLSPLALASVGDSVYDLMVRTHLCAQGLTKAGKLHEARVRLVNATAQAIAADTIAPMLTQEEANVFRRGRNAQPGSIPSSASREEYQAATALETLLGYLYLTGQHERLRELAETAWAAIPQGQSNLNPRG